MAGHKRGQAHFDFTLEDTRHRPLVLLLAPPPGNYTSQITPRLVVGLKSNNVATQPSAPSAIIPKQKRVGGAEAYAARNENSDCLLWWRIV